MCVYLWVFCLLTGELHWGRLISCQSHTHTSSILKNHTHTHTHTHVCRRWFMGRHCHHKWTGPSSLTNTSIKCSSSNNTGTKSERCHSPPLSLLLSKTWISLYVVTWKTVVEKLIFTQLSHRPGIHHKPKTWLPERLFLIIRQIPFKQCLNVSL